MNHKQMFSEAVWVSPNKQCANPYVRKVFNVGSFKKAVITVCGLGFYKLYINGQLATDELFVTLYTDYNKSNSAVSEDLGHRIICQRYDISDKLNEGVNVIGFMLGEGYYHCEQQWMFPAYGDIKLCFNIEITDANGEVSHIISDSSMKWSPSFITECIAFVHGETHDYSLEQKGWNTVGYDDSAWDSVTLTEAPDADFSFSDCPTDKVIRKINPFIADKTDKYTVYDLKENVTGIPIFYNDGGFSGTADITISEAEYIGEIPYHKMQQYFKVILDNEKRYFQPELTWFGCRFIVVPNGIELKSFLVVHSDIKVTSDFDSSSRVLNWLYEAYIRTQLDNMHVGIPMDCPTEERAGYTGDGQLCCESAMLMLDAKTFYRKWINDISDCQNKKTGRVDYTAPYIGRGGGPGGWGCAIVEVPYIYYKMYGDDSVLKDFFPQMVLYAEYMSSHSENGLVISDEPGRWCLGDWCTAERITVPEPFVNTYFLIKSLRRMLEIAEIIGVKDTIRLQEIMETAEKALVSEYFDPESGDFCGTLQDRYNSVVMDSAREKIKIDYIDKGRDFCGTYQATNAFALDLKVGNEKTLKNLVSYYEDYGMFDCGIFGTEVLLRVLFENGYSELALKLLTSEGKYSFGAFMNRGATTLHEYWDGGRSFNHPMFGACTKYLFQYILGIRQENGSAFKEIVINPAVISLERAAGGFLTPFGRIDVSILRENNKETFEVTVPEGISARFIYKNIEKSLDAGKNIITL